MPLPAKNISTEILSPPRFFQNLPGIGCHNVALLGPTLYVSKKTFPSKLLFQKDLVILFI